MIKEIQGEGITTFAAIADELNNRGIRTARGRRWHPMTVRLVLRGEPSRAANAPSEPENR